MNSRQRTSVVLLVVAVSVWGTGLMLDSWVVSEGTTIGMWRTKHCMNADQDCNSVLMLGESSGQHEPLVEYMLTRPRYGLQSMDAQLAYMGVAGVFLSVAVLLAASLLALFSLMEHWVPAGLTWTTLILQALCISPIMSGFIGRWSAQPATTGLGISAMIVPAGFVLLVLALLMMRATFPAYRQ